MKADDLLTIDVGAELDTLCGAQLQGSWQIPAELVRLAVARGVGPIAINRTRRAFRMRIDGTLVSGEELADVATVFDERADRSARQTAIARLERAGVEAVVWAAGADRARFELRCRAGGEDVGLQVRRGRVRLVRGGSPVPEGSSWLEWSCRGLRHRRATAWLRTALRFVPFPVSLNGRSLESGFPGGLYRMRIEDPLPCELAVTLTGESPSLWLLRHGVLAARAVVPGYPAFSAAIEMAGVVPAGAVADELRSAANPALGRIIDQATRMLILLVERLPEMTLEARERITTLLLRFAARDLGRERILAAAFLPVLDGRRRRMASPAELGARAGRRGGMLFAVEPTAGPSSGVGSSVVEATAEQRGLLAELLGIRIETHAAGGAIGLGARLVEFLRRNRDVFRGRFGAGPIPPDELDETERRLSDAAAAAGVRIAFAAGSGAARSRGELHLVGRDRPEVRAAADAVSSDPRWLYPALLALTDGELPDLDAVRASWLTALEEGAPRSGSMNRGS